MRAAAEVEFYVRVLLGNLGHIETGTTVEVHCARHVVDGDVNADESCLVTAARRRRMMPGARSLCHSLLRRSPPSVV